MRRSELRASAARCSTASRRARTPRCSGCSTRAVPHGWHYYWKSWEVPPLTDATIDTLVEQAGRITSPRSYIIVFQLGGGVARVPG